MNRRIAVWVLCVISLGSMTQPVSGQESPLELFGQHVDVLLRLKEPDLTIENLVAMVEAVQPGAGDLIESRAEEALGKLISNPSLTGVDQSRDWYAGVYSDGLSEPKVVFAIPAIDADELQQSLADSMTAEVKGAWVLYTESDSLPVVGEQHVADSIDQQAGELLSRGNVGIYVNVSHLTEVYDEQIELGQEQALQFLNNLRFMMPQQQSGMDLGAVIEVYGSMAEGFFQGLRDAKSLSLSIDVGEKGIAIDELVEFKEGTSTTEYLGRQQASPMALMSKLPPNAVAYYGISGSMKEMTQWGMEMSMGIMGDAIDKEKMKAAMSRLDQVEFGTMVAGIEVGNAETGMFQVSGVVEAKPVDEIRDFVRNSAELMGNVELQGFTQQTILKKEAEKIGDHPVDVIQMTQEYDESADPSGMQKKFQSLMFGPEGMESRTIYLADKYLNTMGGGIAQLESLVKRLESSEETKLPAYPQPLQEQRNLLVYVDMPRMIAKFIETLASSGTLQIPIDENMINSLNLTQSYIGFAVGTDGTRVRCETRIPMEQLQGFAKLFVLGATLQQQQF